MSTFNFFKNHWEMILLTGLFVFFNINGRHDSHGMFYFILFLVSVYWGAFLTYLGMKLYHKQVLKNIQNLEKRKIELQAERERIDARILEFTR